MATIQKRSNSDGQVSWRVLIRLKGHPTETATFARKTDAQRWARETENAILQGRHFRTLEAKKRTLAELIDRYIESVLPERPEKYRASIANQLHWWSSELGPYRLIDVTPPKIAEARDKLAKGDGPSGRPISAATQNRYLAALSHAFTVAEKEWCWVDQNPCRKVRRPGEPRGRVRFLSDGERTRLLKVCQTSGEARLYPLVLLALATGARQGELLGLRWNDIDFERGVAVVHDTKNGDRRALPISAFVADVIRDELWKPGSRDGFVFDRGDGRASFPRKAWGKALEAAEIEDFRFHDLRHSAASYLAMNGATLAEIAEVLGHKTLAMVKRYSHLTEQHTQRIVERMNEAIFENAGASG